ncbi:MAG: universal stress protein [Hyphomicrobiaceae bacterium]
MSGRAAANQGDELRPELSRELNKELQMYRHILIPTDGSVLSEKAIRNGVALAKSLGAKITALTVMEPWSTGGRPVGLERPRQVYEEGANERARQYLEIVVKAALEAGVPVSTEQVFNHHPYEAIIDRASAKGCDLILMASHGWRGLKALVIGSETTKVLTHTKIPGARASVMPSRCRSRRRPAQCLCGRQSGT